MKSVLTGALRNEIEKKATIIVFALKKLEFDG
jgi:hypothetical protein